MRKAVRREPMKADFAAAAKKVVVLFQGSCCSFEIRVRNHDMKISKAGKTSPETKIESVISPKDILDVRLVEVSDG